VLTHLKNGTPDKYDEDLYPNLWKHMSVWNWHWSTMKKLTHKSDYYKVHVWENTLKDIELVVEMSAIDQVEYLHENEHIEDGMIILWAKD